MFNQQIIEKLEKDFASELHDGGLKISIKHVIWSLRGHGGHPSDSHSRRERRPKLEHADFTWFHSEAAANPWSVRGLLLLAIGQSDLDVRGLMGSWDGLSRSVRCQWPSGPQKLCCFIIRAVEPIPVLNCPCSMMACPGLVLLSDPYSSCLRYSD